MTPSGVHVKVEQQWEDHGGGIVHYGKRLIAVGNDEIETSRVFFEKLLKELGSRYQRWEREEMTRQMAVPEYLKSLQHKELEQKKREDESARLKRSIIDKL